MLEPFRVAEHGGSTHKTGTNQSVHGKGGGGMGYAVASAETKKAREAPTGKRPGGSVGLLDSGGLRGQAGGQFVDGKWVDDPGVKPMTGAAAEVSKLLGTQEELVQRLVGEFRAGQDALKDPMVIAALKRQKEPGETYEDAVGAKEWYWNAHSMSKGWAKDAGLSHDQVAGVLAVLSSQANWSKVNVPKTQQCLRVVKENTPYTFTQEMFDRFSAGKGADFSGSAGALERLRPFIGKTIRPMDKGVPGELLYLHPDFPKSLGITGGLPLIKSALILKGGSIDDLVGGIKTRSFFNNIRHPNFEGSVTNDIWFFRSAYGDYSLSQKDNRYKVAVSDERVYARAALAAREAARRLEPPKLRPQEFQAMLWAVGKALTTKAEGTVSAKSSVGAKHASVADAIRKKRGVKEARWHHDSGSSAELAPYPANRGGGGLAHLGGVAGYDVGGGPGHRQGGPRQPGVASGLAAPGGLGLNLEAARALLLEMAQASGGTATSRRGRLTGEPPPPVKGLRASRRNFIRNLSKGAGPLKPRKPKGLAPFAPGLARSAP